MKPSIRWKLSFGACLLSVLISTICFSSESQETKATPINWLTEAKRAKLKELIRDAKQSGLTTAVLETEDKNGPQLAVVLGSPFPCSPEQYQIAKQIVNEFDLVGIGGNTVGYLERKQPTDLYLDPKYRNNYEAVQKSRFPDLVSRKKASKEELKEFFDWDGLNPTRYAIQRFRKDFEKRPIHEQTVVSNLLLTQEQGKEAFEEYVKRQFNQTKDKYNKYMQVRELHTLPDLKAALLTAGLEPKNRLNPQNLRKALPYLRKQFFSQYRFDLLELEQFDGLPEEYLEAYYGEPEIIRNTEYPKFNLRYHGKMAVHIALGAGAIYSLGNAYTYRNSLTPGVITKAYVTNLPFYLNGLLNSLKLLASTCPKTNVRIAPGIEEKHLVKSRDPILAKRTASALQMRPDTPAMLTVIDSRNVEGVVAQLKSQHGFKESKLLSD